MKVARGKRHGCKDRESRQGRAGLGYLLVMSLNHKAKDPTVASVSKYFILGSCWIKSQKENHSSRRSDLHPDAAIHIYQVQKITASTCTGAQAAPAGQLQTKPAAHYKHK